ncbi:LOW QUALITY PROTEIN: Helitron helicase [Phytophthora megakarya]|uniref:Helitron helicase n=1 Tax=Phytophthora megakarya TaxID=4795 RepID=A0A225WK06_9STRA|nr:LOW QUALITY PROTEIN: Helitron helicase [Phytophthora megakarya]
MDAQVYINDLDMQARVARRMEMADGLDKNILEPIDQVMTTHNPYSQQFMNARSLLIERAGPEYQAAVEEYVRRDRAGEARPEDNPEMRLQEFFPDDENFKPHLGAAEHRDIILGGGTVEEYVRRDRAGEARPEDNLEMRLQEFFPDDENFKPHLHVDETQTLRISSFDLGAAEHRDIILYPRQGGVERILEPRASYDPLQYPSLFPYGEPGWTLDLPYAGTSDDPNIGAISLPEYEAYLLHDRTDSESLILQACRLTQPYCVDQKAKCEQSRLRYIENNQLLFTLETLQGLTDALRMNRSTVAVNEDVAHRSSTGCSNFSRKRGVAAAEPEPSNFGRNVIIPPTFTGGPRFMYEHFSDAMSIVREMVTPNLFIMMTCNPNWLEINEILRRDEQASDRPDIVARVFVQKLKTLIKDLDEGVLVVEAAKVHVVENQKRGLSHAHILLIMRPENKPVSDVDGLVSTELPAKQKHMKRSFRICFMAPWTAKSQLSLFEEWEMLEEVFQSVLK